ncbi:GDP dissociation inhibitor-domain-containing protein [Gautieria morchelliformis]|nr:GDP dissociation inhibitor-domain-containing protein [Gautieria morchelliformis]
MDTHFDVLVLGTGLTQSITAAALAKAGFKVAHVDQNAYYGADEASLARDELLEWSRRPSARYFDFTVSSSSSESPLPFVRSYALSLAPALIPSSGPLINALILSGVSRYGPFRLLDAVFTFTGRRGAGALERVPATKADIFKAHDIALVDKRKLMRFLQFAAGDSDFEDRAEVGGGGGSGIGRLGIFCGTSLRWAWKRGRRSSMRWRTAPPPRNIRRQWFLGRKILSLRLPLEADRASIRLQDVPHVLTADVVIASRDYLPASVLPEPDTTEASAYACGIVIVDRPIAVPPSAQASAGTPSHEAPVDDVENTAPDDAQIDTARRYQNIPLRNSIQSSVILTLLESVILGDPLAREVGHIAGSDLHVPVPVHGGMGTSLGAIARVRSKKAWPLAEGEFLSSENIKGGNGLPPGR